MLRVAAIVVAVCVLGACADPLPPLAGVDLPPASMPDEVEAGFWAVSFSHDFEAGFWSEGDHHYELSLDCDVILDEPLESGEIHFAISSRTRVFERVYLRLTGLSDSLLGPPGIFAFRQDQPATGVVTILGLEEQNGVAAAQECEGDVHIDGETNVVLVGGAPFRP